MITNINNRIKVLKTNLDFLFLIHFLRIELYPGNKIKSIYNKKDSNPSLQIYPHTSSFYCFSAIRGGDIIQFYKDFTKKSFEQSILELEEILYNRNKTKASLQPGKNSRKSSVNDFKVGENGIFDNLIKIMTRRGIAKSQAKLKSFPLIMKRRKKIQINVYEAIFEYCNKEGLQLEAKQYLTGISRNLKEPTIKEFRLLSVNDPLELRKYLNNNFRKEHLCISGVFSAKDKFLFFSNPILIPYTENGKIVYYRARLYKNQNNKLKYFGLAGLSSKRIFNKDVIKTLKKGETLYIFEGEFDTIYATQLGYKAIGVPGVTNIPFEELKKINIGHYDIHLAFDSDKAGEIGVQKFLDTLNISVKRVTFENCKDISEVRNA
ncbi:MAG: toprim domain-containing protein [Bacteroidia bacterium]|nr:toprim domain-containing protein [Bacteroidia bacterium]